MDRNASIAAAAELSALRRFVGAPPEFWRRYLAALGTLTGARAVHLFRVADRVSDSQGGERLTGLRPEATARQAPSATITKQRLAAWAADGSTPPMPTDTTEVRHATVPLLTGDDTQRAVVILELPPEANLTAAFVAADVPRDYLERRRATQQTRDVSLFAATLDLLVLLNEQTRFVPAAMLVCNELAARHACERVTLGWLRDHQARLVALSHAENFDRRTEAVRALELAMEECADQDEEIVCPPESDARQVKRDHAAYVATHASGNTCSVPLRADGAVCGVLLFERRATTFSDDDLAALRIAGDQIARRLADLHVNAGGIFRQSLARTRARLARWAGPTHTWWKVGGVAAALLLAFGLFARLPYRVGAPFILRSDQVAQLTAPFEAFLFESKVEPGDEVAAGTPLFSLDTRDLLLEESVARANLVRHEREAERARAADALAEMRIAEAVAEQARAQLEQARWRLSRATVSAPFAGAVIEANLKSHLGAPVRAGDVLVQVARLDTLFFEVEVAETDIDNVTVGARVRVTFASQPGEKFLAEVERIEPAARNTATGAVFVARCRIVDARAPWWRPGMSGVAKIDAGWRMPLWIVTHRTIDWVRMRFWW